MAALARPLIQAAAEALLKSLGITAATGVGAIAVNEAVKKKTQAAEQARAAAIAKAGAQTKARDSCSKCPPDCGSLVPRNWNMSVDSHEYQARITGFAPGTEWSFKGIDFDGFKSQACMLLEAKARYDQFFNGEGKPKFFFEFTGLAKMMTQATTQSGIVETSLPASLHWHFMQPLSYRYLTEAFQESFFPIETHFTP